MPQEKEGVILGGEDLLPAPPLLKGRGRWRNSTPAGARRVAAAVLRLGGNSRTGVHSSSHSFALSLAASSSGP